MHKYFGISLLSGSLLILLISCYKPVASQFDSVDKIQATASMLAVVGLFTTVIQTVYSNE